MKRTRMRNLFLIVCLIAATGAAMAYSSKATRGFFNDRISGAGGHPAGNDGMVNVSGYLTQDKVLLGSNGNVGLNLILQAPETVATDSAEPRNVDMVIVLDRSGSMKGPKINDACRAVSKLLSSLSANDRMALVTYSDGVQIASDLLNVTADNRTYMEAAINGVRAGGGTNLGAGLQAGINLLTTTNRNAHAAKIILISDGLANKGITDVVALGNIAALAVEKEFSVSTVGLGAEFNEHLMTALADRGTGSYYYLENPAAFAEVFQQELYNTQAAAVTNLKIQIPLKNGITLTDAAGYPITDQNGHAVFYPGNLRSEQTRKLFLTLRVPTNNQRTFGLDKIVIGYHHNSRVFETSLEDTFKIACINDPKKVYSSIDKTSWSEKVINEDFNRLKQEVAADIKSGEKQSAVNKIKKYHSEQEAVNAVIGSARVAENLDKDLKELKTYVEETFQGAPQAVQQKQKSNAKALQYDGYRGRRK